VPEAVGQLGSEDPIAFRTAGQEALMNLTKVDYIINPFLVLARSS
jgi:hypothetical protein